MNIRMTGKNLDLTDGLKARIEEKMSKLDRYFNNDIDAQVTLKVQKLDQIAEITIPIKGTILRTEVKDKDMYNSIDIAVEKLEIQLKKYRSKLKNKHRDDGIFAKSYLEEADSDLVEDMQISKVKHFELKPMTDEEAITQMNLLEHDFFLYNDIKDGNVKVVYRKKDGTYGVIVAEQ